MKPARNLINVLGSGITCLWFLAMLSLGLILSPISAGAQPFAYVANYGGRTISVINAATHSVVATIDVSDGPLRGNPLSVAATPNGAFVYVPLLAAVNQTVAVIDTSTNTVITRITLGNHPMNGQANSAAVTPDGTRVYVGHYESSIPNKVSVINTADHSVIGSITVDGNGVIAIAITPDGTRAYVANHNSNNVSVIDTASNSLIATIPVGNTPLGIAITPDGTVAYVANNRSNNVSIIDTFTNTVVNTIPIDGSFPTGVGIIPDGTFAYVAYSGNVAVIDIVNERVDRTIPVPGGGTWVAVTPNAHVYVVKHDTVAVIDPQDNVIANPPVGSFPVGLCITCDPIPDGEITTENVWAGDVLCGPVPKEPCETAHKWRVTVTPTTTNFVGRIVKEEDPGGGGPDTCWFEESDFPPYVRIAPLTMFAPVQPGNEYFDGVGWAPQAVRFYRSRGQAPCGTTFRQSVTISCSIYYRPYITNILSMDIGVTTVSSTRAGATATRTWP